MQAKARSTQAQLVPRRVSEASAKRYLDGVLEGAKVVPVGKLDDRKLVLPFQILNPLLMGGGVACETSGEALTVVGGHQNEEIPRQ